MSFFHDCSEEIYLADCVRPPKATSVDVEAVDAIVARRNTILVFGACQVIKATWFALSIRRCLVVFTVVSRSARLVISVWGWLPGHVNPWTGFDVQEAAAVPLLSSAASEACAKGSSDSTESNLFFLGQQHWEQGHVWLFGPF